MIEELADGLVTRRRRVKRGDGMCTPIEPLALVGEQSPILTPGVSRLALTHPEVVRNPQLFEPAWPKDEKTRLELERMEIRNEAARLRRGGAPRDGWRPANSESYRSRRASGSPKRRYRLP